jgi:hypothetical protein
MSDLEFCRISRSFADLVKQLGGAPGAAPMSGALKAVLRVDDETLPEGTRLSTMHFVLPGPKPVHGLIVMAQEMEDDEEIGTTT